MNERIRTVDRLEVDDAGEVILSCVWALKPGQPQIVAICSSDEVAERYRPFVAQQHPGALFHVEKIYVDHLFGRHDVQSAIYKAATRRGRHDGD